MLDCLIVGGGPAGLTAAIYLGRFLRNALMIDSGHSRAAYIPTSHNYPGFTAGLHGRDFLQQLEKQALDYGAVIRRGTVSGLTQSEDGTFHAICDGETLQAKRVILATGVIDEKPAYPGLKEFIYDGVVRFCPICDGYEAMDKRIGIIGPCARIYKKAIFLRIYTSALEIFPTDDDYFCNNEDRRQLTSLGITLPDCRVTGMTVTDHNATLSLANGDSRTVDVLYPAMGAIVRNDLVRTFDVCHPETGCVITDSHQQTRVPGLYAIGDITLDLSQISVATGQAAIAATAVHNSLPLNSRA